MTNLEQRLDALERQVSALQTEKRESVVRLKWWRCVAATLGALLLAIGPLQSGQAAGSGASPSLVRRVKALETLLAHFSRPTDKNDIYITGANLHIESGSGHSDGVVADIRTPGHGLGNLIIGYDETYRAEGKSGSHNVVIGYGHAYTSYSGLVAGHSNSVLAPNSSITGGYLNTTAGDSSQVSGGFSNTTKGRYSTIAGGAGNSTGLATNSTGNGAIDGVYAHVSGGENNAAQADKCAILGGFGSQLNTVQGTLP